MKLRFIDVLLGLGMFLIPFSFHLFDWYQGIIKAIFTPIDEFVARVLGLTPAIHDLSSDSQLFYVHFLVVTTLSFITIVVIKCTISEEKQIRIKYWLRIALSYYLALILLKYGFDKVFKAQFPLPEPNLLYTPLGKLDKDILFWSTMGSSKYYNLFMGLAEIIPALLLFHHRTRSLGAIIASAVLLNVFAINLSFDISVKLFVSFLLAISLYLALPALQNIINVIVREQIVLPLQSSSIKFTAKPFAKSAIILLIFTEALFPFLRSGNFDDDIATRPPLHGAYENLDTKNSIKKVFFHRDSYLILQDQNDEMMDYHFRMDTKRNLLNVEDYEMNRFQIPFSFNTESKILTLLIPGSTPLQFRKIDHQKLPLLQGQFHWSVD